MYHERYGSARSELDNLPTTELEQCLAAIEAGIFEADAILERQELLYALAFRREVDMRGTDPLVFVDGRFLPASELNKNES